MLQNLFVPIDLLSLLFYFYRFENFIPVKYAHKL